MIDVMVHAWQDATLFQRFLVIEFIYVGIFFILKAIKLQRLSSFGWSMSTNNIMQGIIYLVLVVLFFAPWPRRREQIIQVVVFAGLMLTVTWAYIELLRPMPNVWEVVCRWARVHPRAKKKGRTDA